MATPKDSSTPLAELISLTGRAAIVTGGAMGIGLAIARRLHEAGASIVVADLDGPAAESVAAELNAVRADSAVALRTDVAEEAAAAAAVHASVDAFGRLDILVNNAGIYPMVPFLEMEEAQFEHVLQVNLIGAARLMRAAADRLVEQGEGGNILNVTSIDALHPSMVGLAAYDASKHGLWGLTKNVALELAEHDIRVNALAPGGVATPGTGLGNIDPAVLEASAQRIPQRRLADADEMGRAALFIVSDLGSYLTGSQVVADGGFLLR
jgi:2-deoxy-D-gluconate 3-dehydrogenase